MVMMTERVRENGHDDRFILNSLYEGPYRKMFGYNSKSSFKNFMTMARVLTEIEGFLGKGALLALANMEWK